MSKKIVVVGNQDAILGFRLAGVTESYTDASAVEGLLNRRDVGIVIITSSIALPEKLKKDVEESIQPVFVTVR